MNAKIEAQRDPEAEEIAEKAKEEFLNIKKDKKARKKMYLENQIEEEEFIQKMK